MSIKPTIILVILAILGVSAMAYIARQDQHRVVKQHERQMLLDRQQLPVDHITRITLSRVRADGAPMVFERGESGWNQVKPFAHPMDPFSIRQLIEQALQTEVVERIDPKNLPPNLTPASLQLDPPAATVTFDWNGGSLTLNLGKVSLAGRAYMQIPGDPAILIVNQALHERALQANPKEWRDRTIFLNIGIDSDRIERTEGNAKINLARDRKTWNMLDPVKTRLDPAARDAMFQELGRARVSGFILDQPDDLSRFGLDKPVATLAVTSDGGKRTQKLLIGAAVSVTSQDRFGMIEGRPVVVKIPAQVLGSLFRKPQNLAAATACGTQAADVKSILIRKGTEEFRLERDLEKWFAPDSDRKEVPAGYVDELLNQLTVLKAPDVQFVPYPRDLEIGTITLFGFDGKAIDTVRIAQEKDTGRLALENGDNVLRVFPAGMKMKMTAGEFGLK